MELPNTRQLKSNAAYALRRGREPKKVVLWYAGLTALLGLAVTVLNYWLDTQIGGTGGLGNLGTRTMLSTVQMVLPMAQTLLLSCLELGYLRAMLRICRGQYADQTDFKVGFEKFFPLLRLMLLQGVLIFGVGMFTYQLSMSIYLFTPWADSLITLVDAATAGMTVLDMNALMTDEFIAQAGPVMIPMVLIWLALMCAVVIPLSYRMRMSLFALLDDPRNGAFAALRASAKMTRRNCMKLFKLDISFWWYYVLVFLSTALAYLYLFLPINETLGFFLSYGLYMAAALAVTVFFLNRVQATYVMAYESLHEKPKDSGVVLGNIFDV